MNIHQFNGKLIACFSKSELMQFLKEEKLPALMREMEMHGVSMNDLVEDLRNNNLERCKELSDAVGRDIAKTDDHEIFVSWNIFLPFLNLFDRDSEVCFELNNRFVATKDMIANMDDLKKFRDQATDGDFIIKSKDGFRVIQLKRFRGKLSHQSLYEFIKGQLAKYGKSLGMTNLLVLLQSSDSAVDEREFKALHLCLKSEQLEIKGEILLAYNENNENSVLVRVYPDIVKMAIPIEWASGRPPDQL